MANLLKIHGVREELGTDGRQSLAEAQDGIHEDTEENNSVAKQIIIEDHFLFKTCCNEEELREAVEEYAEHQGSYGDWDYVEEEYLDEEDDDYQEGDYGLTFVTWYDLVAKLEELVNIIKTPKEELIPIRESQPEFVKVIDLLLKGVI